ncbi:MAG: ATPase [Candidatus Bathyarchaeia archaeon]
MSILRRRKRKRDLDAEIFLEEVKVTKGSAPKYLLDGKEVDLWDEPYDFFVSSSPVDYVREMILKLEREGVDPFPSVVGKRREKELVKHALLSGSPILFKGKKGYGKTTFSKSIAELLPERILAIKGCKIYDDPTQPTCFSCKKKVIEDNVVEVAWVPRIWVRVPGDPMLTTRQLIGGISIQKIREGYDLDHPEVFIPGRALKANRGVGYFDELGAVPSSLQTMLHELFEEKQVTTTEGDIVPFMIDTIEIAATNPANYRGTSPIKEPLHDRMEEIGIGPPETLLEEVEIGLRNMYVVKLKSQEPNMPNWHLKALARAVRFARDKERYEVARMIESEPSCRATIKLYDHVKSSASMERRLIPLLSDYGEDYGNVKLALRGRIELVFGAKESKDAVIVKLVETALDETCKEVYHEIPSEGFDEFYQALGKAGEYVDGQRHVPLSARVVPALREIPAVDDVVSRLLEPSKDEDGMYLSALEMILEAVARCTGLLQRRYLEGEGFVYVVRDRDEAGV